MKEGGVRDVRNCEERAKNVLSRREWHESIAKYRNLFSHLLRLFPHDSDSSFCLILPLPIPVIDEIFANKSHIIPVELPLYPLVLPQRAVVHYERLLLVGGVVFKDQIAPESELLLTGR